MEHSLLYYLGAALGGGLILNVMPCVLPVLTMKVNHLMEHTENDPGTNRMHGLAYTAGVLALFLVLAGIVVALKAAGERVIWGQQYQSPTFLAVMTAVIFAFALNALGVFEITFGMSGPAEKEGYGGSFINGIFAAVMSTPCSAPLLGTAIAFAMSGNSTPLETFAVFETIGFGLAFPFLLVTHVPLARRLLPKPGAWMNSFKVLMGFTLLAAAVWLYGILKGKLTTDGGTHFLYFLLVLGLALWSLDQFGGLMHRLARRLAVRGVAVAIVAATGVWLLDMTPRAKATPVAEHNPGAGAAKGDRRPQVVNGEINWLAYDKKALELAKQQQRPVFADFTADWCLSCQTNDKAVIETDSIHAVLRKTQVLPMKADMTDEDEVLEDEMERLGRSGLPIYVIYYPDGSHKLLPEVITIGMLSEALEEAASKYPPEKFRAAG